MGYDSTNFFAVCWTVKFLPCTLKTKEILDWARTKPDHHAGRKFHAIISHHILSYFRAYPEVAIPNRKNTFESACLFLLQFGLLVIDELYSPKLKENSLWIVK